MNGQNIASKLWLPLLGLILFLTAVYCRPLLPIDETRYMSVAWEMSLHHGWLDPLTKNFEPYSHKPPLLFWLINLFWSVFGVSRWAGTLAPVIASVACIYLTNIFAKTLARLNPTTPSTPQLLNPTRIALLMAASIPFLMYGTLIMFDFLVCVFVLLSLIFMLRYAQHRRLNDIILFGLCLGFGVLAKGPVTYLYVLPAYFLAPLWLQNMTRLKSWYAACLLGIAVSAAPVLFWLIPVLKESDNQFAFWLVWNQTAGRVTGNFSDAHVRPFYFYLPIIFGLAAPWVLFPAFWTYLREIKTHLKTDHNVRFLACCIIPVFVAFSLISGKQPHYLVPLLPALILLVAIAFENIKTKTLTIILLGMATFFIAGQFIAKQIFFDKYDLTPVVNIIHEYPDAPMGYVMNYHAEFSFLARRTRKIDDLTLENLPEWFKKYPHGIVIIRFKDLEEIKSYHKIFVMDYRGRKVALVSQGLPPAPERLEDDK